MDDKNEQRTESIDSPSRYGTNDPRRDADTLGREGLHSLAGQSIPSTADASVSFQEPKTLHIREARGGYVLESYDENCIGNNTMRVVTSIEELGKAVIEHFA